MIVPNEIDTERLLLRKMTERIIKSSQNGSLVSGLDTGLPSIFFNSYSEVSGRQGFLYFASLVGHLLTV